MRIVIVGAGGHGQVVADIFRTAGQLGAVIGYADDCEQLVGAELVGVTVIGPLARLDASAYDAAVVAIGDNRVRAQVIRRLMLSGKSQIVARHPSAIVAADVTVGDGSMICAGAIVNTGSRIGRGVILNTGCTVDHHRTVADFAHIAPGVHMGGEVVVEELALIGIGAIILPRLRVGAGSTVGAGAVVTRNVPPGVTVTGRPARAVLPRAEGARQIA